MTFARTYPRMPPPVPGPVIAAGATAFAGIMFFAALISAYLVSRSYNPVWPPPDQPRLPVAATAANTLVLILSAILLRQSFRMGPRARAWHLWAVAAGSAFVAAQGCEWVRLVGHGLTLDSGPYGQFFYLLIVAHAVHAVAGLAVLAVFTPSQARETGRSQSGRQGAAVYWYFVVGIWPILYFLVYLA